jgi:hypothetical protein
VDETRLRRLLDSALVDEPPIGPVAQNALRAGIRRRRRRRALGIAGSAAVVAVAAVAIPTVTRSLGAPPASQQAAGEAAAWVASQVSKTATVSCDRLMCQSLLAHGIPARSLLELRPGRASPPRSSVIVATAAVRGMLGSRRVSVYAPAVIASFGSGDRRIDIREITPGGAAAYLSALSADVRDRKRVGATLLRSHRITASAAARAQLTEGKVDGRLLVSITYLAARRPVSILAFGDSGPGASRGMPLRSVDLAEATSRADSVNPVWVRSVIRFLHGQPDFYVPAHIWTVWLAGGRPALRVEYAAPSTLGLLRCWPPSNRPC